jgi:UDP-glucose 4-epimerase
MKILIIGSKGFIGSYLYDRLSFTHAVFGCDVYTNYNEKNFFLIDSSNADYKSIFANHFDLCVNCSGAASVPDSLKNPSRDYELNVYNVFLILESVRVNNPQCKFINISSAAVYGNPKSFPVSEDHPTHPLSPYGFHKLQAEQLCQEYFQFFGIQTSSIRIFSAYGPGLKKQIFWDLHLKSKGSAVVDLFGSGNETRDFIFIDDIVAAIEVIISKGSFKADIYNVGSGSPSEIQTIAQLFLNQLKRKGSIKFSGSKRQGDPDFWQADISKLAALGFRPKISIDEGIKKYAAWLLSSD